MGIWTDWEAQGTRITQNLLHDNQRPAFAKQLPGGMMSKDIFVEVGHGPTLIDNNLLLSDVSLRMATEGVALVHNLICGSFTSVGGGCDSMVDGKLRQRYTPYHIPHRTEVMGFMTILHGDDRFYNNLFVQAWPAEDVTVRSDSKKEVVFSENRQVGTHLFEEYPTYQEWISLFDMDNETPDMSGLSSAHWHSLPVWAEGNAYFNGALPCRHDKDPFIASGKAAVSLEEDADGRPVLNTDLYALLKDFCCRPVDSDVLGKAFEPEQRFESPDGSAIRFDSDYFGHHRGLRVLPGPFADPGDAKKPLW